MKTPQVKPDWATGIYIGNGVVAKAPQGGEDIRTKVRRMTDEELTFAMKDVREAMRQHEFGSPYHNKLMREYDEILEQMSQNCIREYQKRYGS
jgi:hypothetical protein